MLNKILLTIFFILSLVVLAVSVRGNMGNPSPRDLVTDSWKGNGPFELSPERGRYALTYSLAEDKSFFFSVPLARFVVPDLGYIHGKFVSLFAPAVSYIAIPGYWIGKYFGAAQVGSFAVVTLFAFINSFLIYLIVKKLGYRSIIGFISGFIFLFATPSYAYAVTLYQHHISTFLVLSSVYLLLSYNAWWSLAIVWLMCAFSIPVDYPNLFFMIPIGFYGLGSLIKVKENKNGWTINLKLLKSLSLLSVVLPLTFFLWFNYKSYGNPLQFSGTVASVKDIDSSDKPINSSDLSTPSSETDMEQQPVDKSAVGFFKTRYFINGLYILLFSPDRGLISFTPILLIGILGIFILGKTNKNIVAMLVGIIVANILLYSMWGDPWGGWAFGARYLIPSYAILSIFIAPVLDKYKKNIFPLIFFLVLIAYSLYINTSGALSSNLNPPKVEVLALESMSKHQEKYTYQRNVDMLKYSTSKSFFYQYFAKDYVSSWQFFQLVVGTLSFISITSLLGLYLESRKD